MAQPNLPLGLLRFCIEHSDDPSQIANTDMTRFHRDPADYEWLAAALGNLESDTDKLKKLVATIQNPSTTEDQVIYSLEGIQYYVEDLDVANGN